MTYKVLGQSNPSANTLTDVYTVPAGNSAVLSTITICNLNESANSEVRCAVRPGNATISDEHYIVYSATVAGNETFALTFGVTMAATDVLSVRSTTANVSFNVFGSEITNT